MPLEPDCPGNPFPMPPVVAPFPMHDATQPHPFPMLPTACCHYDIGLYGKSDLARLDDVTGPRWPTSLAD